MTMTFRDTKGANLTPAEVDENFRHLVSEIAASGAAAGSPNGIANIDVVGSQMTVILDDATELGPFTIPRASFRPTVTQTVSAATHDPVADDANGYIVCTNAGGCIVTVPADAAEDDIPVDSEITYRHHQGAGPVSFEAGSDVALYGVVGYLNETAGEGAVVTLKKAASNEWHLMGLLAEDVTS